MLLSENGNGDRRAAELDARIVEKIKRTAPPEWRASERRVNHAD